MRIAMALDLSYHELLQYTTDEREKWRRWLQAHPEAIDVALQPGSGLSTVGKLIDHVFLVERRHLQQLTGDRLSEATGLTGNNAPPLFDYGASVRRELEQLARDFDEEDAGETGPAADREPALPMSVRKILFHILIHEIRHWAQIALAVRLAGFAPPGDHDLAHSRALR
jgi:uncharacterized damage-inducible protein DinB